MPYTDATLRLMGQDGALVQDNRVEKYTQAISHLDEGDFREFFRIMSVVRRFDVEAGNLQRQGQMALWVPSIGQEAAQVGSAFASRAQDHIFPAYREHCVAYIRGLDLIDIIRMLRGVTNGGWDPRKTNNFHLYTLVIASQTLHAPVWRWGLGMTGHARVVISIRTKRSWCILATVLLARVMRARRSFLSQSFQTPQVFFLQNNHWAISVPVRVQSRTPLYERAAGFGLPSVQIDGNDVLMSYAATRVAMDAARSGQGPHFIEALTYRIGAHTTSDDPSKYRDEDELKFWQAHDPIDRFRSFLEGSGTESAFFENVAEEAEDYAADIRKRTLEIQDPPLEQIFRDVFTEDHTVMTQEWEWLKEYTQSFEEGA